MLTPGPGDTTPTTSRPNAAIFDMDGTLVDVSPIRHLVLGKRKDFESFHRESINMPPNLQVVEAVYYHRSLGHTIAIVTAREAKWRNLTAFWLAMHDVPSDVMFMRANRDKRPDREVKADILAQLRTRWDIIHAYDDNPSVVALWVEQGIPTTVIPGWPHSE